MRLIRTNKGTNVTVRSRTDRTASVTALLVLVLVFAFLAGLTGCGGYDDSEKSKSGTWTSKRTDYVAEDKED